MLKSSFVFIISLFLTTGCTILNAQPSTVVLDKPIAVKGKLLFKDDFKTPAFYTKDPQQVKDGWSVKVSHAQWVHTINGLQSKWDTGHMPVLTYSGEFKNAVIELEFRYFEEEGKWSACRVSATNPQINPRAYAASIWANGDNKARPLGMVLEHDEWKPGVITTVDNKPASFKAGLWYKLTVELIDDYVRANCNGVTVSGTHELFGIPKNAIYIGVGTSTHEIRKLRVYEATKSRYLQKHFD
jgi:hypothetical protein